MGHFYLLSKGCCHVMILTYLYMVGGIYLGSPLVLKELSDSNKSAPQTPTSTRPGMCGEGPCPYAKYPPYVEGMWCGIVPDQPGFVPGYRAGMNFACPIYDFE